MLGGREQVNSLCFMSTKTVISRTLKYKVVESRFEWSHHLLHSILIEWADKCDKSIIIKMLFSSIFCMITSTITVRLRYEIKKDENRGFLFEQKVDKIWRWILKNEDWIARSKGTTQQGQIKERNKQNNLCYKRIGKIIYPIQNVFYCIHKNTVHFFITNEMMLEWRNKNMKNVRFLVILVAYRKFGFSFLIWNDFSFLLKPTNFSL